MNDNDPLSMWDSKWEREDDEIENEDAEEDVLISMAASLADIAKTLKSIDASLRSIAKITAEDTPPWPRKNKEKKPSPTVKRKGPLCPECGTPLVERKGPRGPFWGCPKYPKCRGSRSMDPWEQRDPPGQGDIPNIDEFEEGPF